jgi:signal transduction histidine kinase
MKPTPVEQPASMMAAAHLDRINQEMYKRNLALAETNKTLLLLRTIDEVVLSAVIDTKAVMTKVASTLAQDSGFPFAAIYLRDNRRHVLRPQAVEIRIGEPAVQQRMQAFLSTQAISMRHDTNPVARSVQQLVIVTTSRLFEVVQPHLPIEEAEEAQEHLSLKCFFVCPLQARNEVVGALVLGSPQLPDQLGFYQKSLLERLTVAVGIAIDNTVLYAKSQESAAHLRAANRNLKELDSAKDEFISMASHQLRTPLTSIKGYISMLLEGDAGKLTATQQEFLEYAYGGSQRMVGLIADLLNVSRMSAGKFVIEKTTVDLDAVVRDEVQQLMQHATARKLTLEYHSPTKSLPPFPLDESKTRQVIMNFIDNALYYTKKGSVKVSLGRRGDAAELRVTDTGIGVPKEAREHLFTKFYRAGNAQTVRPDGTGLGLFMAKRVVEDQGGTMIFESVEGKGSTFGFLMPLKQETDATPEQPTRQSTPSRPAALKR